jgi:hypothetical protein
MTTTTGPSLAELCGVVRHNLACLSWPFAGGHNAPVTTAPLHHRNLPQLRSTIAGVDGTAGQWYYRLGLRSIQMVLAESSTPLLYSTRTHNGIPVRLPHFLQIRHLCCTQSDHNENLVRLPPFPAGRRVVAELATLGTLASSRTISPAIIQSSPL